MRDAIQNKIHYYRECYKKDVGELSLWNLIKAKKDSYWTPQEEELTSGFLPRVPVSFEVANKIQNNVETYQREKKLIYTACYLVGTSEVQGQEKQIASPLVYYDAELSLQGEKYYLSITPENPQFNFHLLKWLAPDSTNYPINKDQCFSPSNWLGWFQKYTPQIDVKDTFRFPKLSTRSSIIKQTKNNNLVLLSFAQLILVDKARGSRGILHELKNICESGSLSQPLRHAFDEQSNGKNQKADVLINDSCLPMLLSKAQKKSLFISANQALSTIYGPPGTGKSYTIAAVAAEHMSRGKSVLIVANNEHALDVIEEKFSLVSKLEGSVIRAGEKAFLKRFKTYLDNLLKGYVSLNEKINSKDLQAELKNINKQLSKNEKIFIRQCKIAISHGYLVYKNKNKSLNLFKLLQLVLVKFSDRNNKRELIQKIYHLIDVKQKLSAEFLIAGDCERKKILLNEHREQLEILNKAVRARTSLKQKELFDTINYEQLTHAFNIWLVSLDSLHKVLPLKKELFDLVIIDEATQCNIASCIPALYRAKRAVIVGDIKQLRHFSFVSRKEQQDCLTQLGLTSMEKGVLSYRDESILDLAAQSPMSVFLDEHFRSVPKIIGFSNYKFYNQRLKIMQHRPDECLGNIHLLSVNGKRDSSGVNRIEATAVIEKVSQLIQFYQEKIEQISIGIISPFRAQADYINKLLEKNIHTKDIKNFNIRCATPYGFQGEERDIMLLSFSIDNSSRRAVSYLNKEDMFNVCITRAKTEQFVFLSFNDDFLVKGSLLSEYIDFIQQQKTLNTQHDEIDKFQQEVALKLRDLSLPVWKGYFVAGQYIDILFKKNNQYIAIDLIGYPGHWENFFEITTYQILKRAGIVIYPLSYSEWLENSDICINDLLTRIKD